MRLRALLTCAACAALRPPLRPTAQLSRAADAGKAAILAAACSASLLAGQPALAAVPTLNEAIVEVSQTSYPIIKALKPEAFVPFSEKIGKLFLDINPEKLGKSIDLGVDTFLSVPPEKLTALNTVVKESFAGLETSSCTLIPLPSSTTAAKFKDAAAASVDAAKLKALTDAYGPALAALPKTESAICLPPAAALDKLSLAQADIGRSFGAEESKKWATFTTPVLKSSITISKIFPLLDDAKKLAPTATPQEKAAFQAAGKRIEVAAKAEAQKAAFAKQAAAREAAAASKAKPVDPAEAAAARQAAAAEAKAKQEALAAESKAKQAELQTRLRAEKEAAEQAAADKAKARAEAELQRIAVLKAKAKAIAEAKAAASK